MAQKCAHHCSLPENSTFDTEEFRILIVDDEAAILFAYRRLIENSGYTVDACETLAEAIDYISTQRYFAVITDLRLSGSETTEGLAVLACIRDHQPQAKVIVMTGYGGEEAALALGASFYFKKPLEPSVILEALRHLRAGVRRSNQRGSGC